MATKERIHELVDSLPDTPETEQQLDVIENQLEPNDLSAMKRASARRTMKRLTEEEIAANGETLAEVWGYEPKNPR